MQVSPVRNSAVPLVAAMVLAVAGPSRSAPGSPPPFADYSVVPRIFTADPGRWIDLLESAESSTVRICALGDSQETSPLGFGAVYVPNLNERFWRRYGNCPESPLISHNHSAGNGGFPYAGWLWGALEGPDSGGKSPLADDLLPPYVTARLVLDIPPQSSGWLYTLLHDGVNGQDASLANDVAYLDPGGDIRAEFIAATGPGSGEIGWRARPTDEAPSFDAPVTSSGTLVLDLDQPGAPQFVSGMTGPLDFGGRAYMVVEGFGSSSTAPTTLLGVRYRNLDRPDGVVVQTFSDGGLSLHSVLTDRGEMGPFLAHLGFGAFLVHYGVNDAFTNRTAEQFRDDQLTLIQLLREATGDPDLPIAIAIDVHRSGGPPEMQSEFAQQAGAAYEIALADPGILLLNLRRIADEDLGWNADDESFLHDIVHLTLEAQATLARVTFDALFTAAGLAPICPDVNDDGTVDIDDLVAVVLAWGTADLAADVDSDEHVGIDDLVEIIVRWGDCEPPG